jgi:glycerol-3-phosphate acyltransferase PlsX
MKPKGQIVAIDVMGGDAGVPLMISGIKDSLRLFPDEIENLILVGDESEIAEQISLCKCDFSSRKVEICHASESINMAEKPMSALRNKKESSMFKAIDLLRDDRVSGVLSCGNTGCLVAGGTLKLRTMPGIDRPALATVIPAPNHHFVLIDVGANPATSTMSFVHNAVMGSMYYKTAISPEKNPRVGLLTNGTEEGKGSETICEAHEMLKKINGKINYYGLIEGFQLFDDEVDVVLCDGFVGNILLKTMEALAATIKNYVKSEMKKTLFRIIGAALANGAFRAMKKMLNSDKFGGAPLLGLNGIVVKSHGSSSSEAVAHALRLTFRLSKAKSENFLGSAIERVNALIG